MDHMGICLRFKENLEERMFSRIITSILVTNPIGDAMKISRLTLLTLGVVDLRVATRFYETVLEALPNRFYEGITFFQLPGTWLALYPLVKLAEDISPDVPTTGRGFSGMTIAHNARSRDEVLTIVNRARSAGARVVKEPQETFWGGFSGYFADLDGYYWEIAWGPMFAFAENGEMRFKGDA
jgi:hypothetical protein